MTTPATPRPPPPSATLPPLRASADVLHLRGVEGCALAESHPSLIAARAERHTLSVSARCGHRRAGFDLVRVRAIAVPEVAERHPKRPVLLLPDVTELVRDQVVRRHAPAQQDRPDQAIAVEAAHEREPKDPGRDHHADAGDPHGRGVEVEPVEPRLAGRGRRRAPGSRSRRGRQDEVDPVGDGFVRVDVDVRPRQPVDVRLVGLRGRTRREWRHGGRVRVSGVFSASTTSSRRRKSAPATAAAGWPSRSSWWVAGAVGRATTESTSVTYGTCRARARAPRGGGAGAAPPRGCRSGSSSCRRART